LKRKVEWHVQKLIARRKKKKLKRWLRHDENLSDIEDKVIYICEPEFGKILSDDEDERLDKDLVNFHGGRSEISIFQVGNGNRSVEGLI
jgi:hypothetical protein